MTYAEKDRLIEMHVSRWSSVWIWFGFLGVVGLIWALQAWTMTMGPVGMRKWQLRLKRNRPLGEGDNLLVRRLQDWRQSFSSGSAGPSLTSQLEIRRRRLLSRTATPLG